jgi:hypothetical protein
MNAVVGIGMGIGKVAVSIWLIVSGGIRLRQRGKVAKGLRDICDASRNFLSEFEKKKEYNSY